MMYGTYSKAHDGFAKKRNRSGSLGLAKSGSSNVGNL